MNNQSDILAAPEKRRSPREVPRNGRGAPLLVAMVAAFSACGANCQNFLAQWPSPPPAPRVLSPNPTIDEVVRAINNNSDRVQSLSTQQATLDLPGAFALRTSIDVMRPRRMRIRGKLLSEELDLGSNDREFWLWVKRNQPPAIYHCAHDAFHVSEARQFFPIEPEWLIDALGIVWLDPQAAHQGPTSVGNGRIELRTPLDSPAGPMTRVMIIDGASAAILEQHVLDARGVLLASVKASQHRIDAATGVLLPGKVAIQFAGTGGAPSLAMDITLTNLQVNRLGAGSAPLWERPTMPGYATIDLADPATFAAQPGNGAQ